MDFISIFPIMQIKHWGFNVFCWANKHLNEQSEKKKPQDTFTATCDLKRHSQ